MLHEEMTKKILGICFDVLNERGSGFLESVYKKASTSVYTADRAILCILSILLPYGV